MSNPSRRDILKSSAAVTTAAAFASLGTNFAHAKSSDDKIRVGLIGCGGRGTGAAIDCVTTNKNVDLVAMCDLFPDRLNDSKTQLKEKLGENFKVTDDSSFTGFDGYQKLIATDCELVILATPPGFRPITIEAAANAGKHIFAEKPVATDAPGIRKVLAAAETLKQKNRAFVAGTQRRHDVGYIETIKRIHDGAIGELTGGQCYWNQGFLWMFPRKPEWSDMEWQCRNWYYFTWMSGDHIVEQHVHQHDVMNWAFNAHPVSAYGRGGRQVRTDPAYGHIYDHFAIEYTYPNGAHVLSMCTQIDGTDSRVSERLVGTRGTADPAGSIRGDTKATTFRFERPKDALGPYQQEHKDLIDSIRSGKLINECQQVAESTLTAIMGRMSAYTGKEITWEQALNSKENLFPQKLEMGPLATPAIPTPGKTQLT